jgi:succinate dehydrogenase / fumarate reductase flavoprotein subunit
MLDVDADLVDGALARQERRGGHYREDYSQTERTNLDEAHRAYLEDDGSIHPGYKPVRIKTLTVVTFAQGKVY